MYKNINYIDIPKFKMLKEKKQLVGIKLLKMVLS